MKRSKLVEFANRNEKALNDLTIQIDSKIYLLKMHNKVIAKINKTNSSYRKATAFKQKNQVFKDLCRLQDTLQLELKLQDTYILMCDY